VLVIVSPNSATPPAVLCALDSPADMERPIFANASEATR
jgi:hypothetical protein